MTAACRLIGCMLIAVSILDQFQTLFYPAGHGTLSSWIGKIVWRLIRPIGRWKKNALTFAGPISMLLIIVVWANLLLFGWALLFYPELGSFTMMQGIDPQQHHTFADAVNISLGSLITLAGDMMPTKRFLRFAMGVEGVVGFGLLTASVSWLLSVYPILESARSFAQQVMSMYSAREKAKINLLDLPESEALTIFLELATQLATVRNQMAQFPVTYYFNVGERKTGLSVVMPFVAYLADKAEVDQRPGVRLAGCVLGHAVKAFAEFIGGTFLDLPNADRNSILIALAKDHMREPVGVDLMQRSGALSRVVTGRLNAREAG
jgi:hypothetical protein